MAHTVRTSSRHSTLMQVSTAPLPPQRHLGTRKPAPLQLSTSRGPGGQLGLSLNISALRPPHSAPGVSGSTSADCSDSSRQRLASSREEANEPQTPLTAVGCSSFRRLPLPITPLRISATAPSPPPALTLERQKAKSASMPMSMSPDHEMIDDENLADDSDDTAMARRAAQTYRDGPRLIMPCLFLGGESNVDGDQLQRTGIRYVLNVAREVSGPAKRMSLPSPATEDEDSCPTIDVGPGHSVAYRHYKWDHNEPDLVQYFADCFAFIDSARSKGECVLVHCQLGVSRSASLVIAYVMRTMDLGFSAAYEYVRSRAPCISPNLSLIAQLCEYGKLLSEEKLAATKSGSDSSSSARAKLELLQISDRDISSATPAATAASASASASISASTSTSDQALSFASSSTLFGSQGVLDIDVDAHAVPDLSCSASSSENSSPIDGIDVPLPPLQPLAPSRLPMLTLKPADVASATPLPPTIVPSHASFGR